MGKSVKGTKTEKNLRDAFAGESQARNRYAFYAKVAQKEYQLEEKWLKVIAEVRQTYDDLKRSSEQLLLFEKIQLDKVYLIH